MLWYLKVIQKQYQLKSLNIKTMKKTGIIIVLMSIFCIGCKTHCPKFPANLNYFPYHNGQELKFTNSQHNIQNFIISSKNDSKAYSFAWNCKCECVAGTEFYTSKNQDSLSIKEAFLRFCGGEYTSSIDIGFYFQYRNLYDGYLTKVLDIEKPVPYNEIYKYLEDTIIIENDNNKIVKKVIVVKDKGLVSYTTTDGEEWNLVE